MKDFTDIEIKTLEKWTEKICDDSSVEMYYFNFDLIFQEYILDLIEKLTDIVIIKVAKVVLTE